MSASCNGCKHMECMPGLRLVGWCTRRLASVSRRASCCDQYLSKRHREPTVQRSEDEQEYIGARCPACGGWDAELFAWWSEDTGTWTCTVECCACHRSVMAYADKLLTARTRAMTSWQAR